MNTSPRLLPRVLLAACSGGPAAAQDGAPRPDKSAYTLFNPTPRGLMRAMSTDRPDTTESPYTVDAGHVQLEMSFFEYALEDDGPRTDTLSVAPFNLKVGLLNDADLQLVFTPWTVEDAEGAESVSGIGDTQVRFKLNLWGNDGGGSAAAFMPFVSFPTGDDDLSSGRVEGGLIFPFGVDLAYGVGLGVMAEFDFVYDEVGGGYETDFVHTAVLGRDLAGSLGGFVEYVGAENLSTNAGYRGTVNAGLTYGVGENMQWDCGVGVGLTSAAEGVSVFVGLSVRY